MPHRRALLFPAAGVALGALLAGACAEGALIQPGPLGVAGADSVVLGLSRPQVELITGYDPTATLQATVGGVAAGTAPPTLVWSSADTSVASVAASSSSAAVVTARRPGQTIVTVRTASGAGRAESRVVVTAPPPMDGLPVPPAQVAVGGLTVRAVTTADTAPAGVPAGTVRFVVAATLANPTGAAVSVRLGRCPLSFGLYANGSWYGQDERLLVWDQLDDSRPCAAEGAVSGETLTLAPGASRTLRTSVLSTDVLALTPGARGAWPNSTLAVHAHVELAAPDSARAVVDAGAMHLTLPTDRLTFDAAVGTRGTVRDTLQAEVTLINRSALPTYLEFGSCALKLLAYRTADRSGAPAWSSDARMPWEGTYLWGCPSYLATRTVAPGVAFSPGEFALRVPLIEMLGDSLPDGRYYFTAQTRLLNVATPAVDAGALDLALARDPMPAERTYDLVAYRATSVPAGESVSGTGVVRAAVTATLTSAGSALVRFPADCLVRLAAYRTRAARDAAPRAGAPDWLQPTTGCATGAVDVVLARGESRTFDARATARDVLGASLPNGRYYFAAIVRMPGRSVYLSAGEATLAR